MTTALFHEALCHPSPGYALGERLNALYPDRYVLEAESDLIVSPFEAAGLCTSEPRRDVYQQIQTEVLDEGNAHIPNNTWDTVTWDRTTFEVISLRWHGALIGESARHFVVGPNRERTEAFVATLLRWNRSVRGEILVFSDGCFHKSTNLFEAVEAAHFDQLVLEGSFKQQIRDDFTQFLASRATYEEAGVPWRRGALFIGPPGNGKTLCVKSIVRELAIPCLYVQSFENQYGRPQQGVEAVFERARTQAPCILVLEDIDALLTEGSRAFFLNELDGFAANTGVITIATTNHPERLDPSIVERPSRFDRKYHFELPSAATRAAYIEAWNNRLRWPLRLSDAGRAQVTDLTHGFSFAYIQEVFVSSTMHWMAKRDSVGILPVALEQIEILRAQMTRR
ncbi:MAG TPA: ATP-binding protein [Kofleriaceae bacterium]